MPRSHAPIALAAALLLAPALPGVGGGTAAAQTLTEALALAYANNPTLQVARARLRAVDENVPQALAGWRPTVTFTGQAGYVDGTSRQRVPARQQQLFGAGPVQYADTERGLGSLSGTINQPVFQGGRTVAQTRRAENQVLAERGRLIATEQQVLLDTVTSYVNVIRDQEVVRLNVNNEQVLNRQLQATNERFRVGEITRTDVAQAESRLAGARAARSEAEGTQQTSRATFVRLVGQPPGRLTAPQPLTVPVRTEAQAGQMASMNNPNVVAALFDEAAARDQIDVNFSQLLPQVTVQGQAFRNDNAAQLGSRSTGAQVTANLSVPLYQGGAEHARVRQARQQAQQARQQVDEQRRTAQQQAVAAWETLQSARAQVDSQRSQIRAAEIALDGVQREAIVGSRTTLDVLNAEQELLNARVQLVRSLASVVTASYALAASLGRLTALDLALPVQFYDPDAYYRAVRDRWVGLGDYAPPGAAVEPGVVEAGSGARPARAAAAANGARPARAAAAGNSDGGAARRMAAR